MKGSTISNCLNLSGIAVLALLPCYSHAQSSVSIYGIVDGGISYVSNAGGHSVFLLDTGVMQGNRWGLRGSEDLGGGRSAIFTLEGGFALDTGAAGQGGLIMGRQTWVGLADKSLGTVTFGRQYDFMYDTLGGYNTPTWSAGGYSNNPLDNDRLSGQRINNSVKYKIRTDGGLTVGAMYGFSELPGNINGSGRTYSVGVNYVNGPVSLGAAYANISGATVDIAPLVGSRTPRPIGGVSSEIFGIGGAYQVTPTTTVYSVITEAIYRGTTGASSGIFRNYEAGIAYRPSAWLFGFGYTMTTLLDNKYHQGNLTADYFFSKRTDVYVQSIFQHAVGDTAKADIISMPGSSTRNQLILRIGMRHKF